jgi:hypothetical protein
MKKSGGKNGKHNGRAAPLRIVDPDRNAASPPAAFRTFDPRKRAPRQAKALPPFLRDPPEP